MKELSIEEKAKCYDEAIDKVAHFIKKHIGFGCMIHPNSSEAKELFNIFPELKESEDERIRNWLIETIKRVPNDSIEWETIDKSSVLAWLEKQGEQKSDEWSEENITKLKSAITLLQNPLIACDEVNDGVRIKTVDWLKSIEGKALLQLKQEWSEKDKHMLQKVIDFMKHPDLIKATPTLSKNTINWLKSLRPQPKQEWSEEDEYYRGIIMYCLNNEPVGIADKKNAISWLKSLRPQNTWKPSDEQLNNILDVLSFDNCTPKRKELLESLYNDLKKLKG